MSDSLPLGLGCAQLGNLFRERTEDECHAVLDAAWEAGIRHFDTAPHYGLGLSEERLGRFLATKPRDEFVISTKVGRLLRPNPAWDGTSLDDNIFAVPGQLRRIYDYTAPGVRASLEESLVRLGLDRVDIAYLHDPDASGIAGATESGMAALAGLRDEGVLAAIGTGSMGPEALLEAAETGLADYLMVAGRYTLLNQTVAPEVLEACDRTGTRIVAAAVFNSGLLAGKPSAGMSFDYADVPADVLAKAQEIDRVCESHGVGLATAAIHYPLIDQRVTTVVVGADSPEQLRENVDRWRAPVPAALWDDLAERKLVPRCA